MSGRADTIVSEISRQFDTRLTSPADVIGQGALQQSLTVDDGPGHKLASSAVGEVATVDNTRGVRGLMLAPDTVSTDELQEVASQITEIERGSGLSRTLAIGELILGRFFSGSVEQWREKSKHKQHSIRRLAELPACPLGKSALSEAVAVYVVSLNMDGLPAARHIKASHVAAASALPRDECLRLLNTAENERWSVKRLRDEAAQVRLQRNFRRATPAAQSHQLVGALRQLSAGIDTVLGVFDELERAAAASGRGPSDLLELGRARELCSMLSLELSRVEAHRSESADVRAAVRMYGHRGVPRRTLPSSEGVPSVAGEPDAEQQRSTGS